VTFRHFQRASITKHIYTNHFLARMVIHRDITLSVAVLFDTIKFMLSFNTMKRWLSLLMVIGTARAFEVVAPEQTKEAWAHQAAREASKGLTQDLSSHINPRIVGGSNAQAGRYPYYTYLEVRTNDGIFLCSATLIWEDILLTSAHCVVDLQLKGLTIQGIDAFVGLEDQSKLDLSETRVVDVAIPHPNYNANTKENDIMILTLIVPVLTISPVALNFESTLPADGVRVDVFGFGVDSEDDTAQFPNKLQTVALNVVPFADCNDANSFDGDINNNVMICAGVAGGGKVSSLQT
jgi:secreted trypsin-like serine protease